MKIKKILVFTFFILISSSVFAQEEVKDSTYYDASYKIDEKSTDTNGNQYIDVISYDVDYLQILPEKKLLRVKTSIKIKSLKNLNSFYLDFHNSYKILSLKVNGVNADWEFKHGNNLYIKPHNPILKNTEFIVEAKYYNTSKISDLWDKALLGDDFIFNGLPTYLLFPSNEIMGDKVYYNIQISIPENCKLVSIGENTDMGESNFVIKSKSYINVNNFTLSLLKDYSTFSIKGPRIGFGALASKVEINQFTPNDTSDVIPNLIKQVPSQMIYLDSILGYYPYKSFNVIITKDILYKEKYSSKNTVILPYAYTLDSIEVNNRILNGLVKQWFGNKISVESHNDLWLTEGFSKYMEWLIVEQQVGETEFNRMINAKLVESRKYMGLIDWHQMNPHPIYSYDLKKVVYNFNELSKRRTINREELTFIFKVISLDVNNVSDPIKISFKNRFGHDIDRSCSKGHSYYDIISWAKEQKAGSFSISSDGFHTLVSMQHHTFKPRVFKLADPGEKYFGDFTIAVRGALLIHSLRLYFGDEIFFKKIMNFASMNPKYPLSTDFFKSMINRDTNGEIKDLLDEWLYSDTDIPNFQSFIKAREENLKKKK